MRELGERAAHHSTGLQPSFRSALRGRPGAPSSGPGGAPNHLRRAGRGIGGRGLRSGRAVEGEGDPPF